MARVRTFGTACAAALCLCAALPMQALADGSSGAFDTRLDAIVSEWLASSGAPSASIAIVRGGSPIFAKAYGRTRIAPPVGASRDSRYAIDSVSKEFTAAAVLLLAQDGKLSLDDPVRKWYPDLGAAGAVTLRQLLTHTSGIRDFWPQDFVTPEMTRATTAERVIQEWAKRPLDFEPGSEWQYSNTGYVVAAAVVERVSGVPLLEFLEHRIFAPLGMAAVADVTAPRLPQDARGYTRYGLGPMHPAPPEGAGWLLGAANLRMTASALASWDVSLINRSLLHADSYEQEFAPVVLKSGASAPYGLGLDIDHGEVRLRIGHSGSGSGFRAENRVWPAERAAIVVLTNADYASPSELLARIAFVVLTPSPAEARARAVFDALQRGTIDRHVFSPVGNYYLSDRVLADLRSSLAPLGPARSIELEQESKRGGMLTRRWKIVCPRRRLLAVERGVADGPLDQFLVTADEDPP